jgi:hypothetical protein
VCAPLRIKRPPNHGKPSMSSGKVEKPRGIDGRVRMEILSIVPPKHAVAISWRDRP